MLDLKLFTALNSKHPANDPTPSLPPVLPLPTFNGQPPVLLVFDSAKLAVGVAYERYPVTGSAFVRASTRETTLYCIPELTPVFAVCDGAVIEARKQHDGDHRVVIDHGNNWVTTYGGLEHMFVPATEPGSRRVKQVLTGDIIGYLGPTRAGPLRPLDFELWRVERAPNYEQIDPIRHMRRWYRLAWKDGLASAGSRRAA